jgi:pimeloyl-ACP methyl ester carboxylesterase
MAKTETAIRRDMDTKRFIIHPFDTRAWAEVIVTPAKNPDASNKAPVVFFDQGFAGSIGSKKKPGSDEGIVEALNGNNEYTKDAFTTVTISKLHNGALGPRRLNRIMKRIARWNEERKNKAHNSNANSYRKDMEKKWDNHKYLPRATRRRTLKVFEKLHGLLPDLKLQNVKVVAHSQGADALVSNLIDPETFGSTVIIDGQGFDTPGPFRLIGRTIKNFRLEKRESKKRNTEKIADPLLKKGTEQLEAHVLSPSAGFRNTAKYISTNPIRAWNEIRAMHTPLTGIFKALRKAGKRVTHIHGALDELFKKHVVEWQVKKAETDEKIIWIPKGTHNSIYWDPTILQLAKRELAA